MTRRGWFTLAAVLMIPVALALGVGGGVVLQREVLDEVFVPPGIPENAVPQFQLIGEAWKLIRRRYIDQAAAQPWDLAYGAIRGMVQTLGDVGHSRFLTPEMAERHQDFTRGVYEGIGAYVEMREGQVVIVAPIDGSPAQEAGLQAGDVIVSVNGEEVTGKPLDQVVEEITGPAGTEVTLTIRRPETGETRTLTLERASVNVDRVQWTQLPDSDVAYIRISAFSQGVTQELEEALNGIDEADIDGYILDLRNNPGGLLSEAVGVTSRFLADGTVVLRRQADDEVISVPVEEEVPKWTETEMVILINEGTASAAEIVTGALQDAGRATVVGQTTFGAGTVLNQFELSDDSVILLAVEEWLTPAEREIWRKGLAPDVAVALPEGVAPLISFRGEDPTAEALQESGDTQLLRALDILEGESA